MKFLFVLFCLILSSPQFFSNNNFETGTASCSPGDTIDVLIGIRSGDNVSIPDLRVKFNSISGAKLLCFCENLGVFIIRGYAPDFTSRDQLSDIAKKLAGNNPIFIKEGTAKEILKECSLSGDDDPSKIKEILR